MDANPDRAFWIIGAQPDQDSLLDRHGFYSAGLAWKVVPKDEQIPVTQVDRDAERIARSYRPPSLDEVDRRTFEWAILIQYAEAYQRVAAMYASAQRSSEARAWAGRALAVNPDLADARALLARLEQAPARP